MKKIVIIFTFVFFGLIAYPQEFAPTGAKWYYSNMPWSFPYRIEPIFIESVKDTIILNKYCRKLNGQGDKYIYSEGNKVFLYNEFNNVFIKIYDFDLMAGDTVTYRYGWDSTYSNYIIDSVGYTTINSKIRKVQYISTPNNFNNLWVFYGYNIEGIGNIKYLFPQFAVADPIISGGLRCYEDTVLGYYNTGLVSVCDTTLILGIKETETNSIKICPNPATDFIKIENITGKTLAEIYSIDGKLQKSVYLSENARIIINDLSGGIYIIKLQTEKGVIYRKIIKR